MNRFGLFMQGFGIFVLTVGLLSLCVSAIPYLLSLHKFWSISAVIIVAGITLALIGWFSVAMDKSHQEVMKQKKGGK